MVWRITKLIPIAYKKYLLLEINTTTSFLLFGIKYITDRGCLFYDRQIITLLFQCVNEGIHLFVSTAQMILFQIP